MQIHPTYDGKPNTDECCHEYLIDKIEFIKRTCWKLSELIHMVNEELYSMHIPSDVLSGWKIMQAVHGICLKLCRRYTDYPQGDTSEAETNSLVCECQVKAMLSHIADAAWNNPMDNIKVSSMHLMLKLFQRCSNAMQNYLKHIEEMHCNVPG